MYKPIKFFTRNEIKSFQDNIRYAGYCEIQSLISVAERNGYNSGVYGWNYDVYFFPGLTIITGYSPFNCKHLECCEKYEQKARKLTSYDDRKKLLNEFIKLNGGY